MIFEKIFKKAVYGSVPALVLWGDNEKNKNPNSG
jgi:hypothetical protein